MYSAIIYTSRTGSCAKIAGLLSDALGIPAFRFGKDRVRTDLKVIYIGWLCAGSIKGYRKAAKRFNIGAVVQVGMSPVTDESEAAGRKANSVSPDIPLFCLQGGLDLDKLPFFYRAVMKPVCRSIAEKLRAKPELNEQEKATLRMAETGFGEPPSTDIADIVEWCAAH